MYHSGRFPFRPPEEGAALRIGPLEPGQPDDEFHLYIDPGETERVLRISQPVEDAPFVLVIRLVLESVAPGRDVLTSLRLTEELSPEEEQTLGYRLVVSPAHMEDGPQPVELPPIRFLLHRQPAPVPRHLILRITAKYASPDDLPG